LAVETSSSEGRATATSASLDPEHGAYLRSFDSPAGALLRRARQWRKSGRLAQTGHLAVVAYDHAPEPVPPHSVALYAALHSTAASARLAPWIASTQVLCVMNLRKESDAVISHVRISGGAAVDHRPHSDSGNEVAAAEERCTLSGRIRSLLLTSPTTGLPITVDCRLMQAPLPFVQDLISHLIGTVALIDRAVHRYGWAGKKGENETPSGGRVSCGDSSCSCAPHTGPHNSLRLQGTAQDTFKLSSASDACLVLTTLKGRHLESQVRWSSPVKPQRPATASRLSKSSWSVSEA
jgi:hypothetical protein